MIMVKCIIFIWRVMKMNDTIYWFNLTEEHILLASKMQVWWWDAEYGAPCIDPKRPYGDSDVEGDICEILGKKKIEVNYEEMYLTEDLEYAAQLHKDMKTALQIILRCKTFTPGKFKKINSWGNWEPEA